MTELTAATDASASGVNPLQLFVHYSFSSDETYQQGIAAILSGTGAASFHEKSEEEKEYLLRRSRVFYFNRITGYSLTVEETIEYEQTLRDCGIPTGVPAVSPPPNPPAESTAETSNELRVLTFAELKDFIEQGKTDQIPNNRIIPNGLNESLPSQSVTPARKKPWERDDFEEVQNVAE